MKFEILKVGDVKLRGSERAVTIWLPVSKCDQQGMGARRTLKCNCRDSYFDWCPRKLGHKLVMDAKLKGMFTDARLFRDFRGAGTSKTGVIKKWKKTFGEDAFGHSPRRSGAMFYMRQGLPIQELAFLGRWKSSVVLQYTGEALQEKAVEILQPTGHSNVSIRTTNVSAETESFLPKENKFQASPETINERDISHTFDKPKDLWAVTKGRGWKNRPKHRVTKAAWTLPIKSSTTACGWQFANHSSEFYFLTCSQVDKAKCSKCENHHKAQNVEEAEQRLMKINERTYKRSTQSDIYGCQIHQCENESWREGGV